MRETLLARHAASDRVAYGASGEHTAGDLLRDAAAVARALPAKTHDKPLALLGVRRDAYACCAALIGAWERGYEVLVPAADTTREGFLRLALRADVGAVLHDTASSAALPISRILASAAPELRLSDAGCVLQGVMHLAAHEAQPDAPGIRLTGSQLLCEAALLGRSLGLPERVAYASALLPTSRYAWAAGVFWPLLAGGALLRDDPRESAWASQLASAVLIAAPAQIRMLARSSRPALERALHVVSLGAPLPVTASAKLKDAGVCVSDVYATGTLGCLGWRVAPDRPFRPLPEVFLQQPSEQTLQVSAPHIAPLRAARIHARRSDDGGFVATGVGMQRAEWEERIAWLEGVHDAALLRIEPVARSDERRASDAHADRELGSAEQTLPQRRSGWFVTHSAAAPSSPPPAHAVQAYCVALSLDSPARDDKVLQARVLAELPGLQIVQWRSLQRRDELDMAVASFAAGRCELTRNGAGRHDRVGLLRLFGRAADETQLSWDLTVERERTTPERWTRAVRVPERYGYFNGHFPGYPLLPGAAQLSELVVPFVRAVQPELGRLTRMARLKFQERIVPNDLIEVSLTFADAAAEERSVEFALRRGDSVCASGRLWFQRLHAEDTP